MTKIYKKGQFRRSSQEYLDQDYEDKLNDEDKAWLNQFNQEYFLNNRSYKDRIMGDEYNKLNSDRLNAMQRDVMIAQSYNRKDMVDIDLSVDKSRKDTIKHSLNTKGFERTMRVAFEGTAASLTESARGKQDIETILLKFLTDSLEILRQEKQFIRQEKKIEKEKPQEDDND